MRIRRIMVALGSLFLDSNSIQMCRSPQPPILHFLAVGLGAIAAALEEVQTVCLWLHLCLSSFQVESTSRGKRKRNPALLPLRGLGRLVNNRGREGFCKKPGVRAPPVGPFGRDTGWEANQGYRDVNEHLEVLAPPPQQSSSTEVNFHLDA